MSAEPGAPTTYSRIQYDPTKLAEICQRWRIRELALFGSVLRDDFHAESDVDVLVTFDDSAEWTLLDIVRIGRDLEGLFGRPVDVVSRRGIESRGNPLRRQAILESHQVVYAA
ncbi:MAG: nucleotidyltransferase domain-containing protein [Chloroflexota bacterium]